MSERDVKLGLDLVLAPLCNQWCQRLISELQELIVRWRDLRSCNDAWQVIAIEMVTFDVGTNETPGAPRTSALRSIAYDWCCQTNSSDIIQHGYPQ